MTYVIKVKSNFVKASSCLFDKVTFGAILTTSRLKATQVVIQP
jgi:hypothetical protein